VFVIRCLTAHSLIASRLRMLYLMNDLPANSTKPSRLTDPSTDLFTKFLKRNYPVSTHAVASLHDAA
jgi:hypothetical protein